MKTAISIPDEVFQKAEKLARRLKKSRSQLYQDAIGDYLARHDEGSMIEAINRVCDDPDAADPETDAFVAAWARHTLERTEW